MRVLTHKQFQLFDYLCKRSQPQLKSFLASFLTSKYEEVIVDQHYLVAKGNIPICLVAHMDTVFPKPATEIYYDKQKNVIWSPTGLGADDRAGIFAIIQIVKSGLRPHVIFTADEEIGCIGAMYLGAKENPFNDVRYFIELDRRGIDDCVFYDCDNPEFVKYVEDFGFQEAYGSFSDICMICPEWKVAGVNLSVGYRDEHSTSEILFVSYLLDTIDKVSVMLKEDMTTVPVFEYKEAYGVGRYGAKFWSQYYSDYTDGGAAYGDCSCNGCGQRFYAEEVFDATGRDGKIKHFCPDCMVEHMYWCHCCGKAYELPEKLDGFDEICEDCKETQLG